MEYNKLVAVSGLSGLYELMSSKTDGAIVRSLDDKTTKFAASRKHQFSHLESIEIYTTGDNVNLADIFKAMEESGEALPDVKDDKAVKAYFSKVYADMDFDRVYTSDMKKIVKWFDILKKNEVEIKLTEQPAEETENTQEPEMKADEQPATTEVKKEEKPEAEVKEKAPAKKAAPKKAAAKKKKSD